MIFKKVKKWCLIPAMLLAVVLLMSCGPPSITGSERDMAIDAIMESKEVINAEVWQEDELVMCKVIVDRGTSKERARQLGDNLVRLVKTFSKDQSLGKEIGTGIFSYIVGVYYPNEESVVVGAKLSDQSRIEWYK